MNQFDFYIDYPVTGSNWTLIPEPDNWQAMELELSFEDLAPDAVFNATKLVWKGANAGLMNSWLTQGISGGVGIFEGIGLQIKVCASQETVFDGIIDLTDPETKFACDIVQVRIRDKNIDMFQQLVDSISFAYLTTIPGQPGFIKPGNITATHGHGDYVPIAYQRNDIPSLESIMTLILLIWDMYQIILEIENACENGVEYVIAAAASYPAVGLIVVNAFVAALWFAFAVLLTAFLIGMLEAAISCLVSPVLQKYGMFARTLIQKGCDYFGLQFQSTILNDPNSQFYNAVILPTKNAWIDNATQNIAVTLFNSGIQHLKEYDDVYNLDNGGSAYGYYDGSIGDLIRSLEDVFNAKAKIILNANAQPTLHFERWDYQYNLPQYTLPPISDQTPFNSHGVFNASGQSQSAFMTNADEIIANYNIKWAIDSNDVNTLDEYDGNSCFATTQPLHVTGGFGGPYQNRVLLKNLKEINFEFAQATRKETVTSMENLFEDLYVVVYALYVVGEVLTLGILSAANLPSPPLGFTQIGHLLLSGDTTGEPKLFIAGASQSYTTIALDQSNHSSARNFVAFTVNGNNKGKQTMALANFSARSLMKNFHYSTLAESLAPADPRFSTPYPPGQIHYNQWFVYKDQQIPLCCADYQLVKQNNYITISGNSVINGSTQAKVDSLRWNPFKGIASIDYRINSQYTSNLNINFVVDGVAPTYNINTI